jgi:hypothetical protein
VEAAAVAAAVAPAIRSIAASAPDLMAILTSYA